MPTTFEDEDVILYLLRRRRITDEGEEHVIVRTTFRRCRLLGPVHLRLHEKVVLEDCPAVEVIAPPPAGNAYAVLVTTSSSLILTMKPS